MKSILMLPIIIFSIIPLSGCDNSHTIQWYQQHPDAMSSRIQQCLINNEDSLDCKNAQAAQNILHSKQEPIPDLN